MKKNKEILLSEDKKLVSDIPQGKKQGLAGEKLNTSDSQLASKTETQNVNSANPSKQQLNSLLEYYQAGRYDDAEKLAVSITQGFPKKQFAWKVLGAIYKQTGRISESLVASQKSVQLAPQDDEAHSNLGVTLQELDRFDEAEASYNRAIALKSDYAEAHNNLGVTLEELGRLDEAEASLRQAIALKSDFAEAHSLLGCIMHEKGDVDSALHCFKKAFNFDSNLRINELRLMVLKSREASGRALGSSDTLSKVDSDSRLHSKPLILSRAVEIELIEKLYEMTSRALDNTKDARYGNGSCSLDFQLFEDESSIIKTVSSD